MNIKQIKLAKSLLGNDILEVLEKAEIYKPSTNTVVEPDEIKIALQIVPRSILSFLFAHLKPLQAGDYKEIDLPFANGRLCVNKLSSDNYSGSVIGEGKRILEFKYRSLPGIGLILMSGFELYDIEQLKEIKQEPSPEHDSKISKLQDIIDERLKLYSLISCVVNKKLSERDAIKELINSRLNQSIALANSPIIELGIEIEREHEPKEDMEVKELDKKSKLKEFLESRENKREESIDLNRSEIFCPDCKSLLYKGEDNIKLCICYGSFYNKEIKIQKAENGRVRFNFPKKFDIDNIEMLLEAINGLGM